MLKTRNYQKAQALEDQADFGKLRKASASKRPDEEDPEKIKLRHVEREKLVAEEIKSETIEVKIFSINSN